MLKVPLNTNQLTDYHCIAVTVKDTERRMRCSGRRRPRRRSWTTSKLPAAATAASAASTGWRSSGTRSPTGSPRCSEPGQPSWAWRAGRRSTYSGISATGACCARSWNSCGSVDGRRPPASPSTRQWGGRSISTSVSTTSTGLCAPWPTTAFDSSTSVRFHNNNDDDNFFFICYFFVEMAN